MLQHFCLLIHQEGWAVLLHLSAYRPFVHSHPLCPGSPAQDLSRQTVKAGERPLTAEPLPPSPSGHLIWSKGILESGERWGMTLLSVARRGREDSRVPTSAQPLSASRSPSAPPSRTKHTIPSPDPEDQQSLIWLLARPLLGQKQQYISLALSDVSLPSFKENPRVRLKSVMRRSWSEEVLFISVKFCLEGLRLPPTRHFTSKQKSYPYCHARPDLQASEQ